MPVSMCGTGRAANKRKKIAERSIRSIQYRNDNMNVMRCMRSMTNTIAFYGRTHAWSSIFNALLWAAQQNRWGIFNTIYNLFEFRRELYWKSIGDWHANINTNIVYSCMLPWMLCISLLFSFLILLLMKYHTRVTEIYQEENSHVHVCDDCLLLNMHCTTLFSNIAFWSSHRPQHPN